MYDVCRMMYVVYCMMMPITMVTYVVCMTMVHVDDDVDDDADDNAWYIMTYVDDDDDDGDDDEYDDDGEYADYGV